jgi:hypothetical protein
LINVVMEPGMISLRKAHANSGITLMKSWILDNEFCRITESDLENFKSE